ncbi:hypothetical protein [Sphingosinicella xenopeptidilytica]|uniref:Uncharacterized protein n=1 Tax=Sphingosinicella xenopeptidilytica TaxID=364098 RepID=A0ABW3BYP1_SPHXN
METGYCGENHCGYPLLVMGSSSKSVGLGGDGDEIAAIADIERTFGVKLDYTDAQGWLTAGDVFTSLQKVLPAEELSNPELWNRFAFALCEQTGVNPYDIDRDSLLLSESRFWARLADVSAAVWIVAFMGILVMLAVIAF